MQGRVEGRQENCKVALDKVNRQERQERQEKTSRKCPLLALLAFLAVKNATLQSS